LAADGLFLRARQAGPIPLDAELSVAPGELVALLGPSGSGKSTLLRSIAGLYRPKEGRIACNGEVWLDSGNGVARSSRRRRVGLVFQSYALFPHLTALGNVTAAMGHLPRAERERRGRELLAMVHLAGLEQRRPKALSGGQQQRVAVARALARDPAVLLLDEPFSAVDLVTRRKLQRELAELRRVLAMPILLVTHDLDEAAALADRIVILHHGRTLQAGPPAEVLDRPRDAEVARLMGHRNLFRGEVLEHRPEAGTTLLRGLGRTLEARLQPHWPPGAAVDWLVPPDRVVLHRRDRPSRGEHENPLSGRIGELVVLGETAHVTALVDGSAEQPLAFSVPAHVARRNALAVGEAIGVSLLAEGIHLMPVQRAAGS
jgi:molybdate transport system ATP-binding protein